MLHLLHFITCPQSLHITNVENPLLFKNRMVCSLFCKFFSIFWCKLWLIILLFPFASSLDHCGVLTRSVEDAAIVVDAMKGKDKNDMTSWDSSDINLLESLDGNVKGKKLCYVKEICDINNYPDADKELHQNLMDIFQNQQEHHLSYSYLHA